MAPKPEKFEKKYIAAEIEISKQFILDVLNDINDVDAIDIVWEYLSGNPKAYEQIKLWFGEE